MKDFPVIISFYTEKTPYQIEVQNLMNSCQKFGLSTSIEGVESFGTWELNCAYKPFFLLKKLNELKKPVLWVDADGVFLKKPVWQEAFDSDFAVRLGKELADDHPSKVISSTIFAHYSPKAIGLIKLWAYECQKSLLDPQREEEFWDQIALRDAILQNPMQATISSMPLSYAKIFDHPQDNQKIQDPVIEHYQASRRYKKLGRI